MSKRQADLSLEEDIAVGSPVSKKARVEEATEDRAPPNGDTSTRLNGREWEQDERDRKDILAAADQEETALQEAEQERPESPDIDETLTARPQRQTQPEEGYSDLYLDTINRAVLDFDFEKLCSVSLSNINVYACLVCGKYYQGRGPKSYAYFHALEVGHHVFVNMETKKVYVLPEGYEVKSKSLDDIKYVVDPTYTKEEVAKLDKEVHDAWDLSGKWYRPGEFLLSITMALCSSNGLMNSTSRLRWYEQYQSERLSERRSPSPCSCHSHPQFLLTPPFSCARNTSALAAV